jgi:protein gp37
MVVKWDMVFFGLGFRLSLGLDCDASGTARTVEMGAKTQIQWCDSTVNPIMGCAGCELFPSPAKVLAAIDAAVTKELPSWKAGEAKRVYQALIKEALRTAPDPERFSSVVTTTHIYHFREAFLAGIREDHSAKAGAAAERAVAEQITCYAGTLHLHRGLSLAKPGKEPKKGYAPVFETPTQFTGRVAEMADESDLVGRTDPERPWIDGLPRLVFVSDMGDAFSRKKDFPFLKEEVMQPILSDNGRRHLWLWLTKRPELMAEFAAENGGFPENVCAMTTLTGADAESLGRVDALRTVDAPVRGLSIEPLWEAIPPRKLDLRGIDWVIVGGESGSAIKHSRSFEIEWALELQRHCADHGVAFFLKQLGRRPLLEGEFVKLKHNHGGDWDEWPETAPKVREFPAYFHAYREGTPFEPGFRRPGQVEMTSAKRKRFQELDRMVSKFAKQLIVVAEALAEIKRDKLYRPKYKTFQDYCESVHQISRQYANRLVKAGEIYSEMVPIVSKMGLTPPDNEAQMRELSRLPDTVQRVEVLRTIAEEEGDEKLTASRLREEIDRRLETVESERETAPSPSQRVRNAAALVDKLEAAIDSGKDLRHLLRELKAALGVD